MSVLFYEATTLVSIHVFRGHMQFYTFSCTVTVKMQNASMQASSFTRIILCSKPLKVEGRQTDRHTHTQIILISLASGYMQVIFTEAKPPPKKKIQKITLQIFKDYSTTHILRKTFPSIMSTRRYRFRWGCRGRAPHLFCRK